MTEVESKAEHGTSLADGTPSSPVHKRDTPITDEGAVQRQKNEAARRLLREWLADESGYDEEVWPKVKQIIEENRLSSRKRFSD